MLYQEKTVPLKNGTIGVFRGPRSEDAAETIAFLQKACGGTDFLARYPEEMAYTEERERAYLGEIIQSRDAMMIVCTIDGKIAGNCQIVFMNSAKTRHRAAVMIGLLKEYWGLGIGSAMLWELEQAARSRGIHQLELEVIEGNERAMSLYRKMGFSVMAEHPDAFVLKDGSHRKAIFMRKTL